MQNAIHNSRKRSNSSEPGKPVRSSAFPRITSAPGARKDARALSKAARGRSSRTVRPQRQETSAGGIIFRRRNGAVEIFFIKDSYGRWTFPKGHQELGETLAETAIREIREETGLNNLQYVAPLGKTSFRFRREGTVIAKSVHYFLFQAPLDAKERFATRAEVGEGKELIQEGKWVPMRHAFSTSSYKNSDHLLANAFRLVGGARREDRPVPPQNNAQMPAPQPAATGARRSRRHRRRRWKGRGGMPPQNTPPRNPIVS